MGEACSKVSPSQFKKPDTLLRVTQAKSAQQEATNRKQLLPVISGATGDREDSEILHPGGANSLSRTPKDPSPRSGLKAFSKPRFSVNTSRPMISAPRRLGEDSKDEPSSIPEMLKLLNLHPTEGGNLKSSANSNIMKKSLQEPQLLSFSKVRGGQIEEILQSRFEPTSKRDNKFSNSISNFAQDQPSPPKGVNPDGPDDHDRCDPCIQGGAGFPIWSIDNPRSPHPSKLFDNDEGSSNIQATGPQRTRTHQSINNMSSGIIKQESLTQVDDTLCKPSKEESISSRLPNLVTSKVHDRRQHDRANKPAIRIIEDSSVTSMDADKLTGVSQGTGLTQVRKPASTSSKRFIKIKRAQDSPSPKKSVHGSETKFEIRIGEEPPTQAPLSLRTGTQANTRPEPSPRVLRAPLNSNQNSQVTPSSLHQSSMSNMPQRWVDPFGNIQGSIKQDFSKSRLEGEVEVSKRLQISTNSLSGSRFLKPWAAETQLERSSRNTPIQEERSFIYQSLDSLEDFCEELQAGGHQKAHQTTTNLGMKT